MSVLTRNAAARLGPVTWRHWMAVGLFACVGGGCAATASTAQVGSVQGESSPQQVNPLLPAWTGPFGGVPAFEGVQVAHFEPALLQAMDEYREELGRIANNDAAPTLANTLEALEQAGALLDRVTTIFYIWESTLNSTDFQPVARRAAPLLAAVQDELVQNKPLFERISQLQANPDPAWSPEQRRLVERTFEQFVLAGAKLSESDKVRLTEINQKLAGLFTAFSQNVLHDEEHYAVVLDREEDLAGLPDSLRDAARVVAEGRGLADKWAIANTRSAVEPFLTYSTRRELRKAVFDQFIHRGDNGDEFDNNQLVREILGLRAERAKLLGYQTHAHWRLQDTMAKTPEATLALMEAVWPAAVARVKQEVADMQAVADREAHSLQIEPWDYRFYAEKVRQEKYDLDAAEIKPYLQLDNLREGLFWVAGELFDLHFRPAPQVPVYHPDVRVWEVVDADGLHVGLWFFDPFARKGKNSGAWMNSFRDQSRLQGKTSAIVSNNANFIKPAANEVALVSWDDAITLFHEFGHALHGLCSNVRYASLSGTEVARDYVEFPSQLLEHWLVTPEVLSKFALHVQTGQPLPGKLVDKIERARHFNQGFATVEYLSTALLDMRMHLMPSEGIEPAAFEQAALAELGMPREVVMRHRIPQLSHVFSTDAYSAGYYSYLWADTLTADAFEAFNEASGPYDDEVASKLLQHVFSVGNTVDPAAGYLSFRGRAPGIAPLMRKRGFPVPAKAE